MKKSNKSPDKNYKLKRFQWLILLIVEILFVYFMPREIMYLRYEVIKGVLMFTVVLVLPPYLIFKTFQSYFPKSNWVPTLAFGSILIIGPSFAVIHENREVKELENKGVWTDGVIVDSYKSHSGRGPKKWKVDYRFCAVDNNIFFNSASDEDKVYQIGDTIEIVYLPDFPKINRTAFEIDHSGLSR